MDYYNEQDVKVYLTDIDYARGYVKADRRIVTHYDAVKEQAEVYHYIVKAFYFTDGTSYKPISTDDPHIEVVDDQRGIFNYVDQGEEKECRGIAVAKLVESEYVAPREAYDEYEDIYRYILYTDEELAARKAAEKKQKAIHTFLDEGPAQIEDLTLLLSDLIGGETK